MIVTQVLLSKDNDVIKAIKVTQRGNTYLSETTVLTKSINMDMWVVGTSNHFFIRGC